MEVNSGQIFQNVLSKEECEKIPEDILKKLETHFEQRFEEFITAKALFDSTATSTEEQISSLKSELDEVTTNYNNEKTKLTTATQTLQQFQVQLDSNRAELTKVQENLIRYEREATDYRHQRDTTVDERNDLLKTLERRNTELEILKSDLSTLTMQLQAAVNTKCEALVKIEEGQSRELSLKFKENQLDNIRPMLDSQIKSLTEDLTKSWAELGSIQRDHKAYTMVTETKLSEKTEELRIAHVNVKNLTETNSALTNRIDELLQKLREINEEEMSMRENYRDEINSQTKLADLYKNIADDKDKKEIELQDCISKTHKLLKEATEKYGVLETKHMQLVADNEEKVKRMKECIAALQHELQNANELLEEAKQDSLDKAVEILAPSAAATSKFLKSGMSLTQLYSEFVKVTQELFIERNEKDKLNHSLQVVLKEIEEKALSVMQIKLELESTQLSNEAMRAQIDTMITESSNYREECAESRRLANHYSRDNAKLKSQMADLSRQFCFLTKTVHDLRGDVISMNESGSGMSLHSSMSSADLISKKLVTFSDIQELQANNEKLLLLVREMSTKLEAAEENIGEADSIELQAKIDQLTKRIGDLQESQDQQTKMINGVIRQRDMYQKLYQESMKNNTTNVSGRFSRPDLIDAGNDVVTSTPQSPTITPQETMANEAALKELEAKFTEEQNKLKLLRDEYDTYRKEKTTNESMLSEHLESMRKELFDTKSKVGSLVASSEYNEERMKNMKQNCDTLKRQISILEDKNKNYNDTIIKHEQTIMRFKDETLSAQIKVFKC